MIKTLDWDTAMFDYTVGQISIQDESELMTEEFDTNSKQFKLLYIISDREIFPVLDKVELVDVKVRLSKQVQQHPGLEQISLSEYDGGNDEQIKQLAFQSGVFSRFRTDLNFRQNEFEKLYAKWISDSIQKTIADEVLVYKHSGDYKAFVTVAYNGGIAEIGLIAVDSSCRGEGIGLALLTKVNQNAFTKGCTIIEVTTQYANKPAMGLYNKAGFHIESKKYIYHLWT